MKKLYTNKFLLVILVLSLLLVFTACGNTQTNTGNSSSESEQSKSSGNEGEVIKIGAIFAETGPASTLGKTQANLVKLLQKQLDEQGPINGKKIEIIMQDYETDDTKAVVAADKLISEGVVAVVGATQSSTTMAIVPKVTGAGLPLLTVAPIKPDTKGVFQMAASNTSMGDLIIDFLKENNITKIGWINARDGYGVDGLPSFEKLAADNNIEIVAHEEFDANATDMTIQLTNLRKSNPEAIIVWSRTPGAGIVARNFKALGFDIPMIQSNAAANQGFLDQVKDDNEGIYIVGSKISIVEQLSGGEQKELLTKFRDDYRAMFNSDPDNFTAHAMDGFSQLFDAIKAGNTTPDKISEYLKNEVDNHLGYSGIFSTKEFVGPNKEGFSVLAIENNTYKYRNQ